MRLFVHVAAIVGCATLVALAGEDAAVTLEFDQPQTAVLDPANWDTVFPNETYFDALRSMLVRFPGLTDKLAGALAEGHAIKRVELVLQWKDQERARPERGCRGWGSETQYQDDPGQWSVSVYPVLRPWSVDDPALGPTFNAWINGLAYWDRGGGRDDGEDRAASVSDPVPLHGKSPAAHVDITALLQDTALGGTLGQRLRRFEECGLQLLRPETFDLKYRNRRSAAYDWAVNTGYIKVWIERPRLVVTLTKTAAPTEVGALPPATDLAALAVGLRQKGPIGTPSIGVPPDLAERRARHLARPAGLPDWEWTRLNELWEVGTDFDDHESEFNDSKLPNGSTFNWQILLCGDTNAYLRAMRHIMLLPPRTWIHHSTTDLAILPAAYHDLLPPGVLDHLALFWEAWLHPDIEKREDIPAGGLPGGPRTYFRGYSEGGGTQNFDHNAIMGTLLGAQFLNAEYPLREARRGVRYLSAYWGGLGSGAYQEYGDTYYLGITLSGAGAIAKYATDPVDRLLGRFHCDRLVESLVSMYHPGLRRMTHPVPRAPYYQQFLFQEGPYHVVHSLSPKGVLMHLDDIHDGLRGHHGMGVLNAWGSVCGVPILGDEGRPQRFAVLGPWADNCMADAVGWAVDGKSLPWTVHARDSAPDCRPGWHVNYLARNYALASRDNVATIPNHYGVFSVAAQWRRQDRRVESVYDLSTLHLSGGADDLYTSYMGPYSLVQKDGKLLAVKELLPRKRFDMLHKIAVEKEQKAALLALAKEAPSVGGAVADPSDDLAELGLSIDDPSQPKPAEQTPGIRSLHASVMIMSLGDVSAREVWINDRKADEVSGAHGERERDWKGFWGNSLPSRGPSVLASDDDIIAVRDGVTYVGLIPFAVNASDRDREVQISYEYPVMLLHSYVYDSEKALDPEQLFGAVDVPLSGFVIEMGDASQYGDFETFRKHLKQSKLDLEWDGKKRVLNASYRSGDDTLQLTTTGRDTPVARSVNGQWPYIAEGIQRESPWSIQGDTGAIGKGGAGIVSEPGHQTYLLAAPEADRYIGYNPLADPIHWSMRVPGGGRIEADGKLSVTRVVMAPEAGKLWVDWAARPEQLTPELATSLFLFGMRSPPIVEVNGQAVRTSPMEVDGEAAAWILLRPDVVEQGALTERLRKAREALAVPARVADENDY